MSAIAQPTSPQPRVPAGAHGAGQFASVQRPETPVDLTAARHTTAPPALATALDDLAARGARTMRLEDGRRWEITVRTTEHESTFEVEVVDGEPSSEVYHHWHNAATDPRAFDDHDDYLTVSWDDPLAVADTLAARAGIRD